MFYHMEIITKKDKKPLILTDLTDLETIKNRVLKPFLKNERILFQGYIIQPDELEKLSVYESQESGQDYAMRQQARVPPNVLLLYTPARIIYSSSATDITDRLLEELSGSC